jgi:hypothetical protein
LNLRARFGCFFLVIGLVFFLLYAVPLWQAFRQNPDSVPAEWLGIVLASAAVSWVGWKLFFSGGRNSAPQRPRSLGARILSQWKGEKDTDEDTTGKRDSRE